MPIPTEEMSRFLTDQAIANLNTILSLPDDFKIDLVVERNKKIKCCYCDDMCDRNDIIDFHENSYCLSCFEDMFFVCNDCGDSFDRNDEVQVDGFLYCDSCAPTRHPLRDYSAKPDLTHKYGDEPYEIPMGIEIELEMTCGNRECGDIIEGIQSELGSSFVLCEDSSLSHGFEIKSPPMTLAIHRKTWVGDFLRHSGLRGHTATAGIHIHVNRDSLTELQVAKMCVFVNSMENRNQIRTIAQRGAGTYTRFIDGKPYKFKYGKCEGWERYQAINLNERKTIEFRIFNSSTRTERIIKNLEFVRSLCEYCEPAKFSLRDLHWQSYANWMAGSKKKYPVLHSFMELKSLF